MAGLVVPASTRTVWRAGGNVEDEMGDCGEGGVVMGENMCCVLLTLTLTHDIRMTFLLGQYLVELST